MVLEDLKVDIYCKGVFSIIDMKKSKNLQKNVYKISNDNGACFVITFGDNVRYLFLRWLFSRY